MASVPNTRIAPTSVPAGKAPAAAATDPAGFARQLAEVPEELLQIAANILSGGGAPAPDGCAEDGTDVDAAATPDAADAPSEADRLASLVPMLQPFPAVVAAPVAAPAPASAPTPEPKAEAVAAKAPAPAPTTALPAPPPRPTGRARQAKPEAQAETGTDTGGEEPVPALDAAAKEAIAAAKRVIEATLRQARPAIVDAAEKLSRTAARPIAAALQAVKETRPVAPAVQLSTSGPDIVAATAFAQPAPAQATATLPRETAAPALERALDLANDSEWLDRLARDIAQASGNEGTIRFRLHPQTLGHLRVELSQGEHGTAIRLTADTEQARAILADAQPRLVAEARAQGVRIAETHVDLSGSDRHASDPRRQDDSRQTPMIRTARGAAAGEDAPERPGRSRSDRYA